MQMLDARLWTVARFPVGSWTTGGKPSDEDYKHCEVYEIDADSREKATKKAKAIRVRLVKKNLALPSQDEPYRLTPKSGEMHNGYQDSV
jgi:hypothetical protein